MQCTCGNEIENGEIFNLIINGEIVNVCVDCWWNSLKQQPASNNAELYTDGTITGIRGKF